MIWLGYGLKKIMKNFENTSLKTLLHAFKVKIPVKLLRKNKCC